MTKMKSTRRSLLIAGAAALALPAVIGSPASSVGVLKPRRLSCSPC